MTLPTPDPAVAEPVAGDPRVAYLAPIVEAPRISVGEHRPSRRRYGIRSPA